MIKKTLFVILFFIFFQAGNIAFSLEKNVTESDIQKSKDLYQTGIKLFNAKSYEAALKSFKNAIYYNPKMTDSYYNIAAIYVKQGKYDEAYKFYTKIIAINPEDYDAIFQAAKLSYNKQNYSLALKYIKYIPSSYSKYSQVVRFKQDAQSAFDMQKNKIASSKITKANKNNIVLIDKITSPAGLTVDSDGNMLVASYSDNAIIKVDGNKNKTIFVKDYLLNGPVGIAIDSYDNIYVANYDSDNILKITKNGNVSVFMDNVLKPYFIYIKNNILFVSEQGNDAVLMYKLSTTK